MRATGTARRLAMTSTQEKDLLDIPFRPMLQQLPARNRLATTLGTKSEYQ